ncbi:MAG: hypothetical protein ACREX4_20235, partial [Gammaproteobacteria bacterium]
IQRPTENRGQDGPTVWRWLAQKGLSENRVLGRLLDRQVFTYAPLSDPGGASPLINRRGAGIKTALPCVAGAIS